MDSRNEIVAHDGESRAVGIPIEQRVSLLREVMMNPNATPAAAREVAELMFRMEDRDREAAFIRAKVAAISEMPRIGQDGYNSHLKSRFAKWETMQPIVNRVLIKHGLSLSFVVGGDAGKLTVRPVLQGHGWTEQGEAMPLPADEGPGRSKVQAVGSSVSYGKRYTAMAMLNILQAGVAEDDDGAGGGGRELSREQAELIEAGRSAALGGAADYEAWFKALPAAARGWLAMEGEHDKLKEVAARV